MAEPAHGNPILADIAFATHFLDRPRRRDMATLVAVATQLADIMGWSAPTPAPPASACESSACSTQGSASCTTGGATPGAAACGTNGGSGACGSGGCGGESPEKRRAVCAAVLDHLCSGEPTGKPALDDFAGVARRHALPRAAFDAMCDGMLTFSTLKRYATWSRLLGVAQAIGGSSALLTWRVLGQDRGDAKPSLDAQVVAWGSALWCMEWSANIGHAWGTQRLTVPLDDLLKCDLSPTEVSGFYAGGSAAGDARWSRLMSLETQRIASLYEGGLGALESLSPAGRRAASVCGELARGRWLGFLRDGADPFATRGATWGTLSRLSRMPAAWRVMTGV